jgi:transposase
MDWTEEQKVAMERLGIDPACVPFAPVSTQRPPDKRVHFLSDAEFNLLMSALPDEPRPVGAIPNRNVINAIIWVAGPDRNWSLLPLEYGSAEAIRKRAERWAYTGVWDRLVDLLTKSEVGDSASLSVLGRIGRTYVARGHRARQRRSGAISQSSEISSASGSEGSGPGDSLTS